MLDGLPGDTLAKIVRELRKQRNPDTQTICTVISRVTGRDAKRILLDYVPAGVREGVTERIVPTLVIMVANRMIRADYSAARDVLQELLEMEPSRAVERYNLAFMLRKLGRPKPEIDHQLRLVIATMRAGAGHLSMELSEDTDWRYILGRLYQLSDDYEEAARIYDELLKRNPDNTDLLEARAAVGAALKKRAQDATAGKKRR
jgi:tetratricopeptide (TPR) repeat protein